MVPWMEETREALKAKVHKVEQFTIKEEVLSSTANKRKNWTSPGIDGIQNYWWKKFKSAQTAHDEIIVDNNMIPEWWPVGRTVTKNYQKVKNLVKRRIIDLLHV